MPSNNIIPPLKVTPEIKRVMDTSEGVRRQFTPSPSELEGPGFSDPLGENRNSPVPFVIRNYPDRCVLILTEECPVFCRFCNRRRFYNSKEKLDKKGFEKALTFIRKEGIYEVILSGGEPFLRTDDDIFYFASKLRESGVRVIRISTRAPFTMPERFKKNTLLKALRELSPIWIAIHVNHPDELTEGFKEAVDRLRWSGVSFLSQTVLLKGVNDDPSILEKLFRDLVEMGVKPYYLYQCDEVKGAHHFKVPLPEALRILDNLRGRVSGLCIPQFVVDGREGHGKVPLLPNYVIKKGKAAWVLKGFRGESFIYEF